MLYLYLPGYSPKNADEMNSNCQELVESGLQVVQHTYPHWQDDSSFFDVDAEVDSALVQVSGEAKLGIIAKSVGCYLAAKLVARLPKLPKTIVMMGIPVNDLDETELSEIRVVLEKSIPVTVIQNIHDSHGSSMQVKELLKGTEARLITKDSEDHRYYYPQDIIKALRPVE